MYKILYENPNEKLIERILRVRNIDCDIQDFLNPTITKYRTNPYKLSDMNIAVDRIISAIKKKEKIMIFADYDVDGVTSSYILYTFITKFIKYNEISIQYPDRFKDGYGIKCDHIDEIKEKGCSLIITVDNGITGVQEAIHASKLGIDLIITDHHEVTELGIPQALAIVNPQTSPNYNFKGLCGASVAFKLICAIMEKTDRSSQKKNKIFNYFLPLVSIATVADCVPLINENRVIVQRGFELINNHRQYIPAGLQGLLKYLNINKAINSFHVGFVIGPRINAGGRIGTPFDSLRMLLYQGSEQIQHLEKLESLNSERKELQDEAYKIAQSQADNNQNIIIAQGENFHEGIIGIVAGRLSEKYNKPSVVFSINQKEGKAVASLRGPKYFHVVEMLKTMEGILLRYGGHKQAGGMTCELSNLDKVIKQMQQYCNKNIKSQDLIKPIEVDTIIYENERKIDELMGIEKLEPFGIGNEEPLFLIENTNITKIERIGKNGGAHLKLHGTLGGKNIETMFRGQGENIDQIEKGTNTIIGKIQKDNYKGGYFLKGEKIL